MLYGLPEADMSTRECHIDDTLVKAETSIKKSLVKATISQADQSRAKKVPIQAESSAGILIVERKPS